MTSPVLEAPASVRSDNRRGTDVIAQMVQELLHTAAHANYRTGAAVYLPETFLMRW